MNASALIDHEHAKRAVTMRNGPNQHSHFSPFTRCGKHAPGGQNVPHIDHPHTVCPVRAMKYRRPVKMLTPRTRRLRVRRHRWRETPAAHVARVRADPRLDAVHGTHPLRKTHVARGLPAFLL